MSKMGSMATQNLYSDFYFWALLILGKEIIWDFYALYCIWTR